jgi:hypothetical protein
MFGGKAPFRFRGAEEQTARAIIVYAQHACLPSFRIGSKN